MPPYPAPLSTLTKSPTTVYTSRPVLNTEPPQYLVPSVRQLPRRLPVPFVSRTMLFFLLAVLLIAGSGLSYYHWIVSSPVSPAQAASTSSPNSNNPAQIYATATRGAPNYETPMSQNDSSWDWWEGPINSNCAFIGGGAFYASMQKSGIYPCPAQSIDVSDFAYQVQMNINAGDEGGLIFRSDNVSVDQNNNSVLNNYYFFSVGQDGHYSLYYYQNGNSQIRLAASSSPSINRGLKQANLLTVIARGSDIYLYVNNHSITHVTDSRRLSGAVGVFARSNTTATTVQFSNAKIWNLS